MTTHSLALVESLVGEADRLSVISRLRMLNVWRLRAVPLKGAGRRTVGLKWRCSSVMSKLGSRLIDIVHDAARSE